MPAAHLSRRPTTRSFGACVLLSVAAVLLACPAFAQDGRAPEREKPKAPQPPTRPAGYRSQPLLRQRRPVDRRGAHRLGDETSQRTRRAGQATARRSRKGGSVGARMGRQARRALKAASDNLVAIYAKMQPETAATQIAAMDDPDGGGDFGQAQARRGGGHSQRDGGGAGEQARGPSLGRGRRREKILMRLLLPPLLLAIAMSVTGCWTSANEFMREPFFSPVGAGLVTDETASIQSARRPAPASRRAWAAAVPCTASRASPMSATSCGCSFR